MNRALHSWRGSMRGARLRIRARRGRGRARLHATEEISPKNLCAAEKFYPLVNFRNILV